MEASTLRLPLSPSASTHGSVRLLVGVLAAAVMVLVVLLPLSSQTLTTPVRAIGGAGVARLQVLPLPAQSVISTSLGASAPGFAVQRAKSGYNLSGGGVMASASANGVVVRAGASALAFTSLAIGHDRSLGAAPALTLRAHANRVTYTGRNLSAWYAAGPLGIEQGFTVETRPSGVGSELNLALGLGGNVRAQKVPSGVQFLTSSGVVALRYDGLSAVGARGHKLAVTLTLRSGKLVLGVDDAHALYPIHIDPFFHIGSKLAPTDETGGGGGSCPGGSCFGWSVALSANGQTALVGGPYDNGLVGAAWVYTDNGGVWSEVAKLTPPTTGPGAENLASGGSFFGTSVALSADGTTALIGGPGDGPDTGAVWVYTAAGDVWSERTKLLAPTSGGDAESAGGWFGGSVALSADGATALIGGYADNSTTGAAWIYTGSGASWTERAKLVAPTSGGDAEIGAGKFGVSTALDAAGTTALIGANQDNSNAGAAWVFTGSGSSWSEVAKLTPPTTGSDVAIGASYFGFDVALDGAGDTALIGGPLDNSDIGAAWIYDKSGGIWSEATKLLAPQDVGSALLDAESGAGIFGASVALDAPGTTALIGGYGNANNLGAAWIFNGAGSTWSESAALVPPISGTDSEVGDGDFGITVALSATDATTSLIGGLADNSDVGAAWAATPADGFAFSPNPPVFGTSANPIDIGSTETEQLTVSNYGYLPRTIGTLSLSGANASNFSLSTDDCSGQTLEPFYQQLTGQPDCTVRINFTPSAATTYSAQVNIPDNEPGSPDVVDLTGYGVVPTSPTSPTTPTTPPNPQNLQSIIKGHVYTAGGVPLAGATITYGNTISGADGSYQTGPLYPGVYDIEVGPPAGSTLMAAQDQVTVTAVGATTQDFTLHYPTAMGGGFSINGIVSKPPVYFSDYDPYVLTVPLTIPQTGTPNSTQMLTEFAGLEVGADSASATPYTQGALLIMAAHYDASGKIVAVSDPVLADADCSGSAAEASACARVAANGGPSAGASAARVTSTSAHTAAAQPCLVYGLSFKPNALGGADVTYTYADGTSSTFVLAQAQIPKLEGMHPWANAGIDLANAALNVTAAGWYNAAVGAFGALANASQTSGSDSALFTTSALWQVVSQGLSGRFHGAVSLFYNLVTGDINDKAITPTNPVTVTVNNCSKVVGDAYADPSGIVATKSGQPIGGATVTLRSATSATGLLLPVANGSVTMSPANRRNPDHTNALGEYGWDVLPGFYEITATHRGCTAQHGKTATSTVLPVPPAQTGVNLQLRCPHLKRTSLKLKLKVTKLGSRNSNGSIVFQASLSAPKHGARPQGEVAFKAGGKLLDSVFLVSGAARLTLPSATRVSSITATYNGDDAYKAVSAHARL